MTYTRAQDIQIDVWEAIGNTGWTWRSLFPYYKKSEHFQIPTPDQVDDGADYLIAYHGLKGALKVGWPHMMTNSSFLPVLDETMQQLGVPYNRDANGGQMVGLTVHPDTLDREANVREDAARAYFWPYESRSNLKIISNTYVNKIVWSNDSHTEATAIGVETTGLNGTEIIYASKEVILSAGSLKSPVILELSGIGNPDILSKYDIPVKVNISTVGENLQDQTNNGLAYDARQTFLGLPTFSILPSAKQIFGDKVSHIASTINSSLSDYADAVAKFSNGAVKAENVLLAFQIQWNLLFNSEVPFTEIVILPIARSIASEFWTLLPFSRGNIHIQSSDPTQPASINPNYFMFEPDITAEADVAQYIRKIFDTLPLKDLVSEEVSPGLDDIPANATEDEWKEWVKSTCKLRPTHYLLKTNTRPLNQAY